MNYIKLKVKELKAGLLQIDLNPNISFKTCPIQLGVVCTTPLMRLAVWGQVWKYKVVLTD